MAYIAPQIKAGSIPKDIVIYARPETSVTFKWDDIEVVDETKSVTARPMFVTDATNKKTQLTAKSWMENAHREWDHVKREYRPFKTKPQILDPQPNVPVDRVRVIGLDIRGNGGRAWQVLVSEKYICDMREDVLMDAMLNGGIETNGVLSGQYIFAAVNSEMKIIRVGSLLHEKMVEATEFNNAAYIKDLEIGGIYKNKLGHFLYLGPVFTKRVNAFRPESQYNSWDPWYRTRQQEPLTYSLGEVEKQHLIIEVDGDIDPSRVKNIADIVKDKEKFYYWSCNLVKTKPTSYREQVGMIYGDIYDIIDSIKEAALTNGGRPVTPQEISTRSFILNVSPINGGYIHPSVSSILTP